MRKLDYGDYSLDGLEKDIFIIERKKTIGEIAGNLVEKRFSTLLENISNKFTYKYIICEFPYEDLLKYPWSLPVSKATRSRIKIRPPFLISGVSNIFVDYGIPVLFMNSPSEAKSMAMGLMKKVWAKYNASV